METTVHLPWIDMNFPLCWLSLLFCHKLIPPIAHLLIVGIGVLLDDSLFGYEPWVYWQRSCLITTSWLSSLMFLNIEGWMETSVKSVDSIARMQDFLPFVLASLRAAKILLSLNLFVLILNCDPLLGQWTLLRQASFTFCTQFPCPSGLWREVITIECWDVGLLVFWKKRQFFLYGNSHCNEFKVFYFNFLIPI